MGPGAGEGSRWSRSDVDTRPAGTLGTTSWQHLCESDARDGVKNPRTGPPPDGYVRLNQGSTSWDRAELLTQMTGRESIVRSPPDQAEATCGRVRPPITRRKPVLPPPGSKDTEVRSFRTTWNPLTRTKSSRATIEKVTLRNPWNHKQPEPMTTGRIQVKHGAGLHDPEVRKYCGRNRRADPGIGQG